MFALEQSTANNVDIEQKRHIAQHILAAYFFAIKLNLNLAVIVGLKQRFVEYLLFLPRFAGSVTTAAVSSGTAESADTKNTRNRSKDCARREMLTAARGCVINNIGCKHCCVSEGDDIVKSR